MPTRRAAELLGRRPAAAFAMALAVLPALATLSMGLVADDHLQSSMVRHRTRAPWDLFSFFSGVPAETLEKIRQGEVPWFFAPEVKAAFFRPLSSLSLFFDYRFLGERPALAHLHSVVWLAALAVTVVWVYRSFEGPRWTATVAGLVYVWSPAVAFSVAWLAARNTLMATTFGMAALGAHHRFRSTGSGAARVAALALLFAALASGEAAAGSVAFLVAYAAAYDTGALGTRARSVAPYVLLSLVWWGTEFSLGYGVAATSVYSDLHAGVPALLRTAARRFPTLLLYAFGRGHLEVLNGFGPVSESPLLVAAVLAMGLVVVAEARADRALRFWVLGGLLSLLPFCLMIPQARLVLVANVGFSIALARCVDGLLRDKEGPGGARGGLRCLAAPALSGILLAGAALGLVSMLTASKCVRATLRVPLGLSDAEQAASHVLEQFRGKDVVVGVGDWLLPRSAELVLEERGAEGPRSAVTLVGSTPASVERLDDRTLVLGSPMGLIGGAGSLLRSTPFRAGTRVQSARCTVEILETLPNVGPTRVKVTFDAPLEDPSLGWLIDTGASGLVAQAPPTGRGSE